jgi:hypothetical protein
MMAIRDGTLVIALPLAGNDGQHRYRVGRFSLTDMKWWILPRGRRQ